MNSNLPCKARLPGVKGQWVLLMIGIFLITAALGCSGQVIAQPAPPSEEEAELLQSYELFLEIQAQAFQTGDESSLDAVATGETLDWLQRQVQLARSTGRHEWDEYSQVRFWVTSYAPDVAEARFRALRETWAFHPETEERYLVGRVPELHEIIFVMVDGSWKVSYRNVHMIDD